MVEGTENKDVEARAALKKSKSSILCREEERDALHVGYYRYSLDISQSAYIPTSEKVRLPHKNEKGP